jgi:hypothetical protein
MKTISTENLKDYSDLNFVACAKTKGVEIVNSHRDPKSNKTIWYLERSNLLDQVLTEYVAGTLSLPIQPFLYNQKLLKSQTKSFHA